MTLEPGLEEAASMSEQSPSTALQGGRGWRVTTTLKDDTETTDVMLKTYLRRKLKVNARAVTFGFLFFRRVRTWTWMGSSHVSATRTWRRSYTWTTGHRDRTSQPFIFTFWPQSEVSSSLAAMNVTLSYTAAHFGW